MESERKINWLGLFIKIVIIFIFAIIIIWLISKIIGKNKLSETFTNNINNMEKVSVEYFKTVDLPLDKGKSLKITLQELIDKELIVSVNANSNSACDTKESYSKITREKNNYAIETTLKCGKEKDTIKTTLSLDNCKNCHNNASSSGESNSSNNKGSNSASASSNGSTASGTTYYEYVKENTTYTKWMRGSLAGINIENRYEYYGIAHDTYYTLGVIPSDKKEVTYTLKLDNVPNSKYYFMTIEEVSNFTKDEETNYLNEKDVSIYKGNKPSIVNDSISKHTLGSNNITYKLSPYYRKGAFYIRVTITLNNTDGIETYYDNKLQKKAYLIPLKIKVKFASDQISETKPIGEYETISYYRYVVVNKETIWSAENYVEGYTKTGNTKVE